jgi:acetylornithine deacetylase/succinyl-diaminopimelate desuccinylase-like protein
LAVVVLVASTACAGYAGTAADVVGEINQEKYTDQLRNRLYARLGNDRNAPVTGADHDAARDYITDQFRSYGLDTYQDAFTFTRTKPPVTGTFSGVNVVAKLTGTRYPDKMYILGAHYDSKGTPGADDDASGVAGLLEAARVLSAHRFEYTILFIAFDFEEIACSGANSYVWQHLSDKIMGMVELDMIAYNDGGQNRAEIWTAAMEPNPVSKALEAAMARYAGDLTVRTGGGEGGSDHGPFAAVGFDSALLIEGLPYSPFLHRQFDSAVDVNGNDIVMPDGRPYIDYPYATKMLRGAVGWLVESAILAQ